MGKLTHDYEALVARARDEARLLRDAEIGPLSTPRTLDDCASAIQSLIRERDQALASNEALMRERTNLIETKREQLSRLTARAEAAEAEVIKLREAGDWRPIDTHDGTREPVIIAVPTRDRDDYLIGEAYFLEDDDGWWWAGNGPGDYHGGPISEINYHLPEYWQPLPAKPASRADRTLENTNG